jgi:hypothetical protein
VTLGPSDGWHESRAGQVAQEIVVLERRVKGEASSGRRLRPGGRQGLGILGEVTAQVEDRVGDCKAETVEDMEQAQGKPRGSGSPPPTARAQALEGVAPEERYEENRATGEPPPEIRLKDAETDELLFSKAQGKEQAAPRSH